MADDALPRTAPAASSPALRGVVLAELLAGELEREAALMVAAQRAQVIRLMLEREQDRRRRQLARARGSVENAIPLYGIQDFKAHFRMHRASFEQLQLVLGPHLTTKLVSVEKKLLATLWLLGSRESFRSVADRFDLNKGFLHKICMEVCEGIAQVQPQFLSWPSRQEQEQISNRFLHKTGLPGVVGCIGRTHVHISGPSSHRASYSNRKGQASIQVQAVCDDELRFLDVYAGCPGSMGDARVFRVSPLHAALESGCVHEDHHVLGDSTYPLAMYMMVPYRDNGHLIAVQTHFNKSLSSARVVTERAFCLLKSRFQRLSYLDMKAIDRIPSVIMAACVLHNFILLQERMESDFDLQDVERDEQDEGAPDDSVPEPVGVVAAVVKRDRLANILEQCH